MPPALRLAARLAALWLAACACSSGAGEPREAAVDVEDFLTVDGAPLYWLARGADARAPVLLWLHGGPGAAERPLLRHFNGDLEGDFVVVYWDQRGAGRSYDADADPRLLTVARHLADLDALVDQLRARFGAERVVLAGHSWGGALGLLHARDHPAKVAALVLVAPLVSTRESQQREWAFARGEAERRGDDDALADLAKIGPPPYTDARRVLALERVSSRYGAVFYEPPSRFRVVVRALFTGLVTPLEIPRIIAGNQRSLEAMQPELVELDLSRTVPALEVPVLMLLGRHDRHLDSAIAAAYFEALQAPAKRLVWFERSAHNVPFEEPERFHAVLRDELARLSSGGR